MRTGFELLFTRSIKDKFDLSRVEEEKEISFPPIFRLFLETFELRLMSTNMFIAYFPDQEVGFDEFQSNLKTNIDVYKSEFSYSESSMLPFASSGIHGGGICVCLNGLNSDKIFVNDEMVDGRFRLIADNVFEFVRGLIEVEDGDDTSIYF